MSDHDDLVERLPEPVAWMDEWGELSYHKPSINPEPLYPAAAIIALQEEVQELNKLLADGANGRTLAAEAENAALREKNNYFVQVLIDAKTEVERLKAAVEHQSAMAQACNLEVLSLKAELAEAHRVIEPFASFFNKVLEGFTPDYLKRRDPESIAFGWNEGRLYLKDFIRARSFINKQKTGEKEGE